MDAVEVLAERCWAVEALTKQARRSLWIWRGVFYTVGIAAVVSATAAGASSLADLGGPVLAGGLALLAAVLASVDKFLGAVNRVNSAGRRHQGLLALLQRIRGSIALARFKDAEAANEVDDVARAKLHNENVTWFIAEDQELEKELQRILLPDGASQDFLT